MSNPITGLFETLVAAMNEAAQCLKFSNAMLDSVFMGHRPTYDAAMGETININIPIVNEGDAVDIGASDIQITDNAHNSFPLTLSRKPTIAHVIRSFDQVRTPQDMRALYSDAWMESLMRAVNRQVCNLVTTGNFNTYSSITGGADTFSRANIASAWQNLANGAAPVNDTANLCFMTSPIPYGNMLADTSFYQESIVGVASSESTVQRARIMPQYGAQLKWDQQFPQPSAGATYAGLFFHRYAIAMRAGVEPDMTAMSNGARPYEEFVVHPASHPNLPIKVQLGPSLEKQGLVVAMSVCYGLKVVRPEFGSFLVST